MEQYHLSVHNAESALLAEIISSDTWKKHHQNQASQTNQTGRGREELMDVNQPIELEMRQVENLQANEKETDCITTEEAIDGNLKKISISSTDRTKYDPMSFLKGKEEKFWEKN